MSDRPPVVDFSKPYNPLSNLALQRERLTNLVRDVERSIKEVQRFEAEGEQYASYAVAWAATMTLADILKISLSAADQRAALLFKKQDEALAQASKVLQMLGFRPLTTKADLLKAMDPSLQVAPKLTEGIRKAQKTLKDAGVKVSKPINVLLDLATTMCEDTALMIDAGMTSQHIQNQSVHAQARMRETLNRLRVRLLMIEHEFTRQFEAQQLLARTA